ncbi:TPA: hypothetical protein ACH3X2_011820 [Trebouxia sp. C0005]
MLSAPAILSKTITWQRRLRAYHSPACCCVGTEGQDRHVNQLPAVVATPGQQALDKARQQLLRERQANSQYASLPVLMGQSEDTGGLQQSAQATECLPPVDNKALKELQDLLPDLAGRWQKLQPQILLLMTADTSIVAVRLLQLKMWFPEANVSTMVSQRPTLVLDEEFNGIPAAMKVLQHWFAADAIDHMVQEEPLFLVEDVESAISSLNRWMSTTNGAHKLQRHPHLLLSLVPNRKLSLW